jgi:hypothetical protein
VLADLGLPVPVVADVLQVPVELIRLWHGINWMPPVMLRLLVDLGGEQIEVCEERQQWRVELETCDCDACVAARTWGKEETLAEAVGVAAGIDVHQLRREAGL